MLVIVGSKNPVKIRAVKNAFSYYFENVVVEGIEAKSGVKEQPLDLNEIVQGAKNRANHAWQYKKCDFAVGQEAGIFKVKGTNSGYADTACIAIFDGKKFHLGFTPMFEYPKKIIELALKEKITVGKVAEKIFNKKNPAREEGLIGWLSKGAMPREKLQEYGVIAALASIVSKELFE